VANKKQTERNSEIRNRRAFHDFNVEDKLEAGLVLRGTEVKSVRAGKAQIQDAFVRFDRGKPVLYHAHIDEYEHGNLNNHRPRRPRPLLLNRKEIDRLQGEIQSGGKTIIPLRIYFRHGLAKIEIGLATGKKKVDKRQTLRQREDDREADRYLKQSMRGN